MQLLIDWAFPLLMLWQILLVSVMSNVFNQQNDVIVYNGVIFTIPIFACTSLLSYFSTWRKLNRHYAIKLRYPKNPAIFRSGYVGSLYYRVCLKIGIFDDGIYLYNLMNILAIFHRPLLIPWSDIIEFSIKEGDFRSNGDKTYLIKIQNRNLNTKLILPIDSLKDAEDILKSKMKFKSY